MVFIISKVCCGYPRGDGYLADVFPESVDPLDTRVKTAVARALADS